ncbi:MAG: hypothetical protein IPP72_20295 [Chitinophagaceae bacterium]|nr:hypothetical protein [Chitinophagaceae bacterium]
MPVIAWYILKIILCSAILFSYYWLALRNKIFHQYNRFYLLVSVVLSITLPFVQINIWPAAGADATDTIRLLKVVSSGNEYLDEIIVTTKSNQLNMVQFFNYCMPVSVSSFLLYLSKVLSRSENCISPTSIISSRIPAWFKRMYKALPFHSSTIFSGMLISTSTVVSGSRYLNMNWHM